MAPHDQKCRKGPACPKCGDTDCVCPDDESVQDGVITYYNKQRYCSGGPACPICGDTDCVCPDDENVECVAHMLINSEQIYSPQWNAVRSDHSI